MCCCCLRRAATGAREAVETAVAVASADLLLRLEGPLFSTVWVAWESRVRKLRFERRRGFSSFRYGARQRSFRITGNVGVVIFGLKLVENFLIDEMA